MSPIIWLTGTAGPVFLGGAYVLKDVPVLCYTLTIVAILPLLAGVGVYLYFAICDPNRLQSEEHNLKAQLVSLIEAKGGAVVVNPVDLEAMANPFPYKPAIEAKRAAIGDVADEADEGSADA